MKRILLSLIFIFFAASNIFCAEIDIITDPSPNTPYNYGLASAWLPSANEDVAIHIMSGSWILTLDGVLFASYSVQDVLQGGLRSTQQFTFPNWFMLMAEHPVFEKNRFLFKTMFSFEPITQSSNGAPLLFQTSSNASYADRQHPNDLISEISLSYEQFLFSKCNLFAYIAFPGEPALGPPSYLHRPSARNNPDSPLGYNWQDAAHITYGVATLGFKYSAFKVEGSAFNGNWPDQNYYNIDTPNLHSWSTRISFNPLPSTAAQFSYGMIKSPNVLYPTVDIQRITFSVVNIEKLEETKNIATSFIWGMNIPTNSQSENSFLLESDMEVNKSHSIYCRFEVVQKEMSALGINSPDVTYVNAFTLGTAKKLANMVSTDVVLSIGAQATVNFVGEDLKATYGSYPLSVQVYFKLAPCSTE